MGYLHAPVDFIHNLLPLAGYTDDATTITAALALANLYIDNDVKQKIENKIGDLLGEDFVNDLD